jgi:hypothetical protein
MLEMNSRLEEDDIEDIEVAEATVVGVVFVIPGGSDFVKAMGGGLFA